MDKPLVSIALCTYNGERFLREQLDSLVQQTYPNLEIIAVDDCSTDKTCQILFEYAARYPIIKIYQNESNLGFVKNFERAVGLCSGQLIAFSDQDDIWNFNKIELQVAAIGDHVFVYHDSEFVTADGAPLGKKMSDVVNLYRGDRPEVFLFFNCVSGHSILIKKAFLQHALPLAPGYFHDWWISYVATNLGTIDFVDQCLIRYRQHENNDTNILRLEKKTEDRYAGFSRLQKLQRQADWIKICKNFEHNKNQLFVDQLYQLFITRFKNKVTLRLANFMLQNRKLLFFIQRKSDVSKLNFIRKMLFGIKIYKQKYN